MRTLPIYATLLGLAGLAPFILASLGALGLDPEFAHACLVALVAYGGVILAFLGGVHWGLALAAGTDQTLRVQRLRFGLGVVPSLVGWAALLLTLVDWPKTALLLLIAGFLAVTIIEARATRASLMPRNYMMLRWVVSVGVIFCLATTCLVLSLGGRVAL